MKSTKLIIGLTGYFCSGKSTAGSIFQKKHDFYIIDVDKIGHNVLEEKKTEIIKKFGQEILTENSINRKLLAKIVFNDKKKLKILNSIVHPLMIKKVKESVEKSKNKKILINAALLFQMGLDKLCSHIIFIKASLLSIVKRALKRGNTDLFRIIKILIYQKQYAFCKKKLCNADIYYIRNDKKIQNLYKEINNFLKEV
ncbi:MAG: dephospho-CoA kinase [Spirochaetes bacterium]|nr:dephospho-CoA kinase [Spirochaetota bacterium]